VNGLFKSFGYALRGIEYVIRYERNARIHLLVAILALLLGLELRVSDAQLAAIFFAVIIVFLAEIINTAFEKTLDLVSPDYHPQVKIVKDMAAGAVLVAAGGAVIIGLMIYTPYVVKLLS
jgi:diacylglycerol kinase (ATP)